MKVLRYVAFMLFISLLVAGCGKKAGIEGKIVDGKGQPMSGIKIIAKQAQPIKGYEHFETKTGSDGVFKFNGVFPSSDYIISPWSDDWKTESKVKAQSGPEGQTSMLDKPLIVRFTTSKDGVISDSKVGLQWAPANGQAMNWFQADAWVRGLNLGGGGWRLPTRAELKSIYDTSFKGHADPAFNIEHNWVWTSESYDPSSAWHVSFASGGEYCFTRVSNSDFRALAVRSRK